MAADRKSLKTIAIEGLSKLLSRWDKVILTTGELYEWQLRRTSEPIHNPASLPDDARKYLLPDNPRLIELKARYEKCDPSVTTPLLWKEGHVRTADIAYFRGDNAYVWQVRGSNANIIGYALATYYTNSIDCHKFLNSLQEDDAFGNFTFKISNHLISRDLLDSIIEIDFLDRHLGLMSRANVTILDIGAGYGRLAHRLATAVPGLGEYLCADAVPYSTFISEFYLRFRNVAKARVVALDEFEQVLATKKVDIAVNVHSFSECRLEAIEWWVMRLAHAGVKHLMVAPNALSTEGKLLLNNEKKEFSSIIERQGYRLLLREPKYRDLIVQKYAISPTHYFLFELT